MGIQDVDLMDPRVFTDGIPHEHFRAMRHTEGLVPGVDTDGERFWHVVRYEEVAEVSRTPAVYSTSPSTMTSVRKIDTSKVDPEMLEANPIMAFLDGPKHIRLRKLTHRAFSPARVSALTARTRATVATLLEEVQAKGEFDMAEDVALRLPFEMLADLLGVPDADRVEVLDWARQSINLGDPDFDHEGSQDSILRITEYLRDMARRRLDEPADDLCSILLDSRLKGDTAGLPDRMTVDEVAAFVTMVITAAADTVFCSVTGAVLGLLEHRDQLDKLLADRSLMPRAVEEILRWVTPVTHFARNVVQDTELAGQPLKKGERVVIWYTSANRDETVFADPDLIDITRSPNPHLTFGGGGPHVCMGIGLAMMELHQFLDGFAEHLPRLEITATPVRPETNFMNSVKRLPMRFR